MKLFGELGPQLTRERAERRIEVWLAAEAGRVLAPLKALDAAMADGRLIGLAKGVAYRLREAGGAIDRRLVAGQVKALSPRERRALKAMGIRFTAFSVHIPQLLQDEARSFILNFDRSPWRPPLDRPSRLPEPPPSAAALGQRGLIAAGPFAVPVHQLEQLDARLRAEEPVAGAFVFTEAAKADLGWEEDVARGVMMGLGFSSARKVRPGQPSLWRMRRVDAPPTQSSPANPASPFAALAGLKPVPQRQRPRRFKAKVNPKA